MSHVINASHTTPTTHVNQGPIILKLIGWRYCLYFRWVPYIPGTTTLTPGVETGCTVRYYSNNITVAVWDVSHPQIPCSGTIFRLCNLYPRSTQNTDVVSSINFSNLSVSCPFTLLFNSVRQSKFMLLEYWDDALTVVVTVQ